MRRCFLLFLGLWVGFASALAVDANALDRQTVVDIYHLSSTPYGIYQFSGQHVSSSNSKSKTPKKRSKSQPKNTRFIYSTDESSFIMGINVFLGFDDFSFNRNPEIEGFIETQLGGEFNLGLKVGDVWRLTVSPGLIVGVLSDLPSYVQDYKSTGFLLDVQTSFDFVHFKKSAFFVQLGYQYEYKSVAYFDETLQSKSYKSGLGNIYEGTNSKEQNVQTNENRHKIDLGLGFRCHISKTSDFHLSVSWHVWENMDYKQGWGLNPYPFSVVGFSFAL